MGKSKKKPEEVKTRGYRLLLYPDNTKHLEILETIKQNFPELFLGIWHNSTEIPENTTEQEMQEGKKHAHILLYFPNPRFWPSVCKSIGFVDSLGSPDYQFCRAIGYDDSRETVESFMVYMTHRNQPDKEQYNITDLWGSDSVLKLSQRAHMRYHNRKIEMPDAVLDCLIWIDSIPKNKVITYREFAYAACSSAWFKAASNPIVRAVLEEHNFTARQLNSDSGEGVLV